MANRWKAANPSIPINLQGLVNQTNPQGYYFSFGTHNRGTLLEIYHPFYNATRSASLRSISKAYATAVGLALQDQGLLDIDAPAYQYVPALNKTAEMRNITLRMVFTHTSGIVDPPATTLPQVVAPFISLEDSVAALLTNPLGYQPGNVSVYAEYAYQILGAAAEAVTGKSYNEVWQTLIAKPSKMNSTAFWNDNIPYDPKNALNPNTTNPMIAFGGVGTAADVTKFMRMLANKGVAEDGTRVLSENAVKQFTNWTGSSPFSTVNGATVGIPAPCSNGKNDIYYNIKSPPDNFQYNTVDLTPTESFASQGPLRMATYGLGLWVFYDDKCRKSVSAQGLFNNYFEIFDIDGKDPLEIVYMAAVPLFPPALETTGRAVWVPAAKAVLGDGAFVVENNTNGTGTPPSSETSSIPVASGGKMLCKWSATVATIAVAAVALAF
jgi:CubicO group peptidase (beta-lactamase class C family)